VLAWCGCHADDWVEYSWDDRKVLCSRTFDDLSKDVEAEIVDGQISDASDDAAVALAHAHGPGTTVSLERIEHVLDEAMRNSLDFVTFRELVPGSPRAAIAVAFDDSAVEAWSQMEPLLEMYGAHVTFFVARYEALSPENKALLRGLADAGHDIEAHTVNHLNALDYVSAHGVAAYVDDEVVPSIEALRADGYDVTSFAFPFGASNDAINAAVLEHVQRVRVGVGHCPY
jgi:peptidoglycan/xylan/chitin deacetylase (PgdA/CDA1 family)